MGELIDVGMIYLNCFEKTYNDTRSLTWFYQRAMTLNGLNSGSAI